MELGKTFPVGGVVGSTGHKANSALALALARIQDGAECGNIELFREEENIFSSESLEGGLF